MVKSMLKWTGSVALPLMSFLLLPPIHAECSPQDEERYQEIRVSLSSYSALRDILATSPDLELMELGDGDANLLSRPYLTEQLLSLGKEVAIVHDDLEEHYARRALVPADYGIWHDYEETVQELHALHDEFPEITTPVFRIGLSEEGREILGIKLSDSPEIDEDEPELLYDAVHHAREIMSLELNLYLARYLCEGYGSDPLVTSLVDEREIYFVPIVNPDGFVYNQVRQPSGGGMWRKNRRNNGACYGVDLNRNYPFQWGGSGSSGNSCAETYRGPAPASEPEVRAMVEFINSRRFVAHESIHSVAGMILFPWGYGTHPTPDDDAFRLVARERARENGYVIGQAPEILYTVDGDINDWAYGEQTERPKIYSFTTEVGGTGFWPSPSERDGLLQENLSSMLYLAKVAGRAARIAGVRIYDSGGNDRLDPGETADLVPLLLNEGLAPFEDGVELRLRSDDPYLLLLDARSASEELPFHDPSENSEDSFRVRVEEDCPSGRIIIATVELDDRTTAPEAIIPLSLTVGDPPAIVTNDFENPGDEWRVDEASTANAGGFECIDPTGTEFQPDDAGSGTRAWITGQNDSVDAGDVDGGEWVSLSPVFDLSRFANVRLQMKYFFGQRDPGDDPGGDYFVVEVREGPSSEWIPLLSIGDQASSPDWRTLAIDLRDVIDLTAEVELRLRISDGPASNDIIEGGIDDFRLMELEGAGKVPEPPLPLAPADSAENVPAWVTLTIENVADPNGDELTYGFRIYADADNTSPVAEKRHVNEGPGGVTSWTVETPLPSGTYFWRAYAESPSGKGLFGPQRVFTTTDAGTPPSPLSAFPNPSWKGLRIRFQMPEALMSELGVYDATGRRIRILRTPPTVSGWQEAFWDGRDDEGRFVPQGSYWVRLWTSLGTRTLRVARIGIDQETVTN